MLRKDLCENDAFNALTMPAQILYMMLILHGDDEGCFRADAKHWSRTVFYTKRQGSFRVERMLDELRQAKLIITGETKYGLAGFILGWFNMQTLTASKSKPSKFYELLVAHGITPRWGISAEENVVEEKRSEVSGGEVSPGSPSRFREVAGKYRDEKIARLQAEKRAVIEAMSMGATPTPIDFDEISEYVENDMRQDAKG